MNITSHYAGNSAKPFKSSASPQPDLPMILLQRPRPFFLRSDRISDTVPIPTRAPPVPQHVVVRASLRGLTAEAQIEAARLPASLDRVQVDEARGIGARRLRGEARGAL